MRTRGCSRWVESTVMCDKGHGVTGFHILSTRDCNTRSFVSFKNRICSGTSRGCTTGCKLCPHVSIKTSSTVWLSCFLHSAPNDQYLAFPITNREVWPFPAWYGYMDLLCLSSGRGSTQILYLSTSCNTEMENNCIKSLHYIAETDIQGFFTQQCQQMSYEFGTKK